MTALTLLAGSAGYRGSVLAAPNDGRKGWKGMSSNGEDVALAQALHEQRAFAAYTSPGFVTNEKAIAPYLERKARAVALLAYIDKLEGRQRSERAQCPDCGRMVALRKGGVFRAHDSNATVPANQRRTCKGSGRKP